MDDMRKSTPFVENIEKSFFYTKLDAKYSTDVEIDGRHKWNKKMKDERDELDRENKKDFL